MTYVVQCLKVALSESLKDAHTIVVCNESQKAGGAH